MGKTGKTLNEGKFLFFQHGKSCLMLGSFLPGTGTGKVIPGNDWIPGSRQKTSSATKESS